MSQSVSLNHATPNAADPVAAARHLGAIIRDRRDESERERRLPATVLSAMHDARLFRMYVPIEYGGLETDPITSMQVVEAVAEADATSTIPIVFAFVGDPVASDLVASLARPGGNLTGFSNMTVEMQPKRLELLCELIPRATVIALLVNPDNSRGQYGELMHEAARMKGVQLSVLKARTEDEIDTAFAAQRANPCSLASATQSLP